MTAPYREYAPPAGLTGVVACLWENDSVRHRPQRIVPDGCVDLVWFGDDEPVVVGADTGPRVVAPVAATVVGVRLRPGAAGAVLGLPAAEVRDQLVALSEVWGHGAPATSEPMTVGAPGRRLPALTEAVLCRRAAPDQLVVAAARKLGRPGARVGDVAADLGVSERQLRRRTLAAVGYGPKTLARVARLRRLIAAQDRELAVRAVAAGYSSQAHMNEEVRRLTGLTPVRFLEDAILTAA